MNEKAMLTEVKRKVMDSVHREITSELQKCRSQQAISDRSGHVRAGVDRFATDKVDDDTLTFPEFLPVATIPLPDPITTLRQQMKCNTKMGLFPSISRAWITIDNTLLLWNYSTGIEFVSFSDIPEVIVNVALIQPKSNVFPPIVQKLVLVMTPSTVFLLGLVFTDSVDLHRSTVKILSLGYCVRTNSPLTHAVQHDKSGCIFASGLDGNLYEIVLSATHTRLVPKMRLINHSVYFAQLPVLSNLGHALSSFQQTWLQRNPICRDMAMDQQKQTIYILRDDNIVDVWSVSEKGTVSQQPKVKHDVAPAHPLSRIFAIVGGHEATSLNGTRFVYEDHAKFSVPPAVLEDHILTAAFVTDNVFIGAHVPSNGQADCSDVLTMVSTPHEVIYPHKSKKEVVSVAHPTMNTVMRIEAIGEVPLSADESAVMAGELCRQIVCPARQFALLHRYGLSIQAKLRPVDLLHLILSHERKETSDQPTPLLDSFVMTYAPVDYCCMLFQLAGGNIGVNNLFVDPYSMGSPNGVMRRLSYSSPSRTHLSSDDLGQKILSPVSADVSRRASELLRSKGLPPPAYKVEKDSPESPNSTKTVEVTMSHFCVAANIYVARALFCIWDDVVCSTEALCLKEQKINSTYNILRDFESVVKQFKGDLWVETLFTKTLQANWKTFHVQLLSIPADMSFSDVDANMVHSSRIYGILLFVDRCLQILQLLSQLTHLTDNVMKVMLKDKSFENATITFSKLVTDNNLALSLVRAVVRTLISMEAQSAVPQYEAIKKLLSVFEQECPSLYNQTDAVEYQARMDLDHMMNMRRKGNTVPQSTTSVVCALSQRASSLWRSGQLDAICSQMIHLGNAVEAVDLYLHAAAQIDVPLSNVDLYLAGGVDTKGCEKDEIARKITDLLEQLWMSNRAAFDQLMGIPFSKDGRIWSVEPSDQITHFLLLHWLQAPRGEANVRSHLQNLFICAASPYLETFLMKNQHLKMEMASFYRHRKRDFHKAIQCFIAIAASPLSDQDPEQRMKTRFLCLDQANACAQEGGGAGQEQIEVMSNQVQCQQKLLETMKKFLNSNDDALNTELLIDGRQLTQKDFTLSEMDRISSTVMDAQPLFQMAHRYVLFGAAEVQLKILNFNRVNDTLVYCETLVAAFNQQADSFEENALHILRHYYDPILFPLDFAIKLLEYHFFALNPQGSAEALNLLDTAQVGLDTVLVAYCDIVEESPHCVPLKEFDEVVSKGYRLHSFCVALHRLLFSKGQKKIQVGSVTHAYQAAKSHLGWLAEATQGAADGDEAEAIRSAIEILNDCQRVM